MTLSNTGPFGPFRYTVPSDSWWWSEEVYAIHGFQPGAVVPSTELMLAHAHPSDSEALSRALRTAATEAARSRSGTASSTPTGRSGRR